MYKISKTFLELLGSKLQVGSSAKIKLGELAKDLAIATLCASPPDNFAGLKLKRFSNPRTDNSSLDFFSAFTLVLLR